MKYKDKIYGEVEINEPVILELIKSPTIQRLKFIDQAGFRSLWLKPESKVKSIDHSRFAHSVGVYILLKKYKASVEEQIAGLIHDVSHSAFSHCIDYALDEGSEKNHSHQDNLFEKYIRKTEIPSIIKKFDFDLGYILNEKNFPLKEKELPDLCADRIDYSLRTALLFNEINLKEKNYLLNKLKTKKEQWFFEDPRSAKKYAELFLKLNRFYYSSLSSAIMLKTVGGILKYALDKGYLTKKDLYTTDPEVINKIKKHINKDKALKLWWQKLNGKIKVINSPKKFDYEVFCKSRIVNPLFIENGKFKKLSQKYSSWQKIIKAELKPKQYFLRYII